MHETLGDGRLAELVREGDPLAFGELSSRYMGMIRRKAAQFTGPGAPEPEDMVQEGLLGLYSAALGYKEHSGRASFGTYAGTCVHNRMVSAVRSYATAGNRTLNRALSLTEAGDMPEGNMGPQELVEAREQFRRMWQGLELSDLERRVLGLYLSGCPRARVEERSGISLKAFDNALYRIRSKLRESRKAGDGQ